MSVERISRLLLGATALLLAAGGTLHAMAYPKARSIADHSDLAPFAAAAFKGLWLSDSVTSGAFAAVFLLAACYPRWAARPLLVVLALGPLAVAVAVYSTMGNFFGGHMMLAAGITALIGALLKPQAA